MKYKIQWLLAVLIFLGISGCDEDTSQVAVKGSTEAKATPEYHQTIKSAREIRGASPYAELENEPPPKLIVDPPLPNLLAEGVVWIQWRAENVHILPIFGKG